MRVYVRNRHRNYGDPNIMFPYQAVLWFRPEGNEPGWLSLRLAGRFQRYLAYGLGWGIGALAKVQPVLMTNDDLTSRGVLFSNRKFADEARDIIEEWLYEDGEYMKALRPSHPRREER